MSEEPKFYSHESEPAGSSDPSGTAGAAGSRADESWQEVGRQFESLGASLAQAMRTAWENEENQRRLQELRKGLESMVREIGQAIDDSLNTPQGQKVREDTVKTVETLRTAGEQTVQEIRPQLISALEQLNTELQKFVNRMEQNNPPPAGPEDKTE